MTIYTADSGALVFATGSVQWSWGLDSYNTPAWHTLRVNEAAQRITKTVIARMLQGRPAPRPRQTAGPSPIVVIAAVVAAGFVLRAWLNRPRQRAAP
jgi:hypothetical protein